jgi:crotonobetaine/carnitine-CoA ligase
VTFAATWRRAVDTDPDAPFLRFEAPAGDTTTWSYGEFDDVVARVAGRLAAMEVGRGMPVHMALANCPTFVAVWLAVTRLGAWMVPSDPMARTPELDGHIARTRPVVGLCAADRADTYRAASGSLPVIEVDETDVTLAGFGEVRSAAAVDVEPSDRTAVMFTSGTTGVPKGVEVTQANYAFAGKVMAEAAELTAADRQLVVLPLFHANAQYYSFASAVWVGASVALMATFSASRFLEQAARHEATAASLFAAPIRMILARGEPVDGLRLRHCWYAQNITRDQFATVSDWLGCKPRQLYGMTETIPAVLTDEPADPDPASMGRVSPGCEVDVQDADGRSVAPGEVGEVVVGGQRGVTLFAGYLDAAEITEASFRGRWFLTGDRAVRAADGRHFFQGRRSDVLKVAGENVSIVEVEAVLADHPGVLEAAVVGRPDPVRDEVPVAFVVPAPGREPPSVAELEAWCEERLGKAKRPTEITVIDELPRTSVGKIRKFLLVDRSRESGPAPAATE